MKKINAQDVPELEQGSPQRKYHVFRRHLSVALGAPRDVGTWGGGHPFEVELTRVPAGAANFPLHQHSAQWELYLFISGSGEMTDGREASPVGPGDVVLCAPEQPHKIVNTRRGGPRLLRRGRSPAGGRHLLSGHRQVGGQAAAKMLRDGRAPVLRAGRLSAGGAWC
ncbi:MAG: cupin domain-containing protein [Verrucomicrobiota bacterium]